MKSIKLIHIVVILAGSLFLAACAPGAVPLEDTKWVLTSYGVSGDVKTVLPDTQTTALFDSEKKEVTGSAGCNTYFASYEVDDLNLAIPGPIAVTEMWCGDEIGEQERIYLEALQAADSYRVENGSMIINCGNQMLYFERR